MAAKIGINRVQMRLNPKQEIARLREYGGIFWSALNNRWLIVDQALAIDVLRDERFALPAFSHDIKNLEQITGQDFRHLTALSRFIPFLHNGAYHKSIREVLAKILVHVQPKYFELLPSIVDGMIRDMAQRDTADFARDFAKKLHLTTLAKTIGMPASSVDIINPMMSAEELNYNNSVTEFLSTNERLKIAYAELSKLVEEDASMRAFGATVGTYLLDAGLENTFDNRIYAMMSVMIIGRDTIAGGIALSLNEAFEQMGDTIDGENLRSLKTSARDLLRMTSPVNVIERQATEALELDGQALAKGALVHIVLRAVNTDPSAYGCPHARSAETESNDGFVFGSGIHTCLGRNMAYEALRVSFERLSQLRAIHLVGEATMGMGRNTQGVTSMTMRIEI